MKYVSGGISGSLGQALVVEVPVAGTGAVQQQGAAAQQAAAPAGPVAQEKGDDVLVDPPVRCLPQWDKRWGGTRMAGKKTGVMLDWKANGCNASTAAMTLRWFAEDCPAGKIPFPAKPGGSIDKTWYSPRLGEAFWPNADPPGKVALDSSGHIDTKWIFSACAHYLQTGGDLPRADNGDVAHPATKAYTVENEPKEGWLPLLRKMLKTGPVIMGLGAPSGHYVIAHAVIGGAVAIVDPGNVLCTAKSGGKGEIQNWASMSGYLDAGSDLRNADKVRMPKAAQWPGGDAPGNEGDYRAYNLISGQFLAKVLENLHRLVSLTYPDGPKFGGAQSAAPAPASQPKPQSQPEPSKPAETAPAPADDKPLPKPIEYAGGQDHGLKRENGEPFPPSTPGTIRFIKPDKPAQPDCWKQVRFREHSHFKREYCVDMNASSNKSEYPYGQDVYGPAVPFTPVDRFTASGFGGYVGCVIESGEVIEFGHFDHISAEVYWAAKEKRQLPAGTYLGKCTKTIGLSAGPHCHMQARKKRGGDMLKRDQWLPWLGVPADRVWWPGKK